MMVGIRDDGSKFAFKADDPIEMALAVECPFSPLVRGRWMNCVVVEAICHKMICDFILAWARYSLSRRWKCVGRVERWIAYATSPAINRYWSWRGRDFNDLPSHKRLAGLSSEV